MNKSCWYGKSHCGERAVIRCNLNSTIWFSKFVIHPYFEWGEDFYGYVSYNTWTRISFGWWCFGALFPQNTSQCYVAKRDISDIRLNQDWIRYLEIHCSQERECFIRIHNFFVEICLYSFRQRCSLNASATKNPGQVAPDEAAALHHSDLESALGRVSHSASDEDLPMSARWM